MTLPASPPISLTQVATEMEVALPISLNSTAVRNFAGVSSGNLSLLYLLGKSKAGIVNPLPAMYYDDAVIGTSSTTLTQRLDVATDGTILVRRSSNTTGNLYNYYNPKTTGIGSSYWVRLKNTSKTRNVTIAGETLNSWLALSTLRYVTASIKGQNVGTAVFSIEIASNSTGTNIVTSGSCSMYLEISY